MRVIGLLGWLVMVFGGVGCAALAGWDTVDYCPAEGCTSCANDADCAIVSDCCGEKLTCGHQSDLNFSTCAQACEVPTPPDCLCQDGRCQF